MKKLFIFSILLPLLVVSCSKEEVQENSEDYLSEILEFKTDGDDNTSTEPCFEIQFPITVIMPDGSEFEGDSKAEINRAVKAWFQDNGKAGKHKARIELQFPFAVEFQGKVIRVRSQTTLDRIHAACKGMRDGDGNGKRHRDRDGDHSETPCLELVFPISFEMADGTIITGDNRQQLSRKMNAWHDQHPRVRERGEMVFPVSIKFKGELKEVENERQMQRFKEACK